MKNGRSSRLRISQQSTAPPERAGISPSPNYSFVLMSSKFIKLQSEMFGKHLRCVNQRLQGRLVTWPRPERQGRSRHPNGPGAGLWLRLERQGRL